MPQNTDSIDTHRARARNTLFIESNETPGPDTRPSSPTRMIRTERTTDRQSKIGLAQNDRGHRKWRRNELDILLSTPSTLGGEEVQTLTSSHRNSVNDIRPRQIKQEEINESNPAFDESSPIARMNTDVEKMVGTQLGEAQGCISTRINNERLGRGGVSDLEDRDARNAHYQDPEETLLNLSHAGDGKSQRRARAGSSFHGNSVVEDLEDASDSGDSGDDISVPRRIPRKVTAITRTEHRRFQHPSIAEPREQQARLWGQAIHAGPVTTSDQSGAGTFGNTHRTVSTSVETTSSPAPATGKKNRSRVSDASMVACSTNNDHHSRRIRTEEEDTMNEDERLLASEAGKQLSSKDRRRLRNKISAKAHRSRRRGMCSLPAYHMVTKQA